MPWIGLDVALAVVGLAVLAAFSVRLYRQVRGFGREVSAAGERLGEALAGLDRPERPAGDRR
jgi:hypothetical protein